MCGEGMYPTYAIDNPTGKTCVKDGMAPPNGFVAYPPNRVPEVVGDEYDRWPLAPDYPWAEEVDPVLHR